MSTPTTVITQSRASLRTLAAKNGWALQPVSKSASADEDVFIRGDRKVHTSWCARGWFDAPAGRFYSAFLIDLTADGQDLACILDEGGVAKVRAWLKADA